MVEWASAGVELCIWLHYGIACEGKRTVVLVHGYPEICADYGREEWLLVCRILEAGKSERTSSVSESPLTATTKASAIASQLRH